MATTSVTPPKTDPNKPLNTPFLTNTGSGSPLHGPIQRGWLQVVDALGGAGGIINFQYNPNEVSLSYAADLNQAVASAGQTPAPTSTMTTVEFPLLFNRMMEVAQGDNQGVFQDIAAFQTALGLGGSNPAAVSSIGANTTKVVFSTDVPNNLFTFTGMLSGLNIHLSMFSEQMVPTACDITITLTWVSGMNTAQAAQPGGTGLPGTPQ